VICRIRRFSHPPLLATCGMHQSASFKNRTWPHQER
jgi:hypothetical protein